MRLSDKDRSQINCYRRTYGLSTAINKAKAEISRLEQVQMLKHNVY